MVNRMFWIVAFRRRCRARALPCWLDFGLHWEFIIAIIIIAIKSVMKVRGRGMRCASASSNFCAHKLNQVSDGQTANAQSHDQTNVATTGEVSIL